MVRASTQKTTRKIILTLIGIIIVFSATAGLIYLLQADTAITLFAFSSAIIYSLAGYWVYQNKKEGYYFTIILSVFDLPVAAALFSGTGLLIAWTIDIILVILSIMMVRK